MPPCSPPPVVPCRIIPSTNTTNGSLPPGVCPFASYPDIHATCQDSITFVTRAIPAGLRAHGTYLLQSSYVNTTSGDYRCPSVGESGAGQGGER